MGTGKSSIRLASGSDTVWYVFKVALMRCPPTAFSAINVLKGRGEMLPLSKIDIKF
jgi:hypothetical protein